MDLEHKAGRVQMANGVKEKAEAWSPDCGGAGGTVH